MLSDYFGQELVIFVDKENVHPDPLGKLIWGYDISGEVIHGDFQSRFTRMPGKPFKVPYNIEGCMGHTEERVAKLRAIKAFIKTLKDIDEAEKGQASMENMALGYEE